MEKSKRKKGPTGTLFREKKEGNRSFLRYLFLVIRPPGDEPDPLEEGPELERETEPEDERDGALKPLEPPLGREGAL